MFEKTKNKEKKKPDSGIRDEMIKSININSPQFNLYKEKNWVN